MKHFSEVIIVGGGASGLFAGILLARSGYHVTILEQNKIVGKKLALTGNGSCNYANLFQSETCYQSSSSKKAFEIISAFDQTDILQYFKTIGIMPDVKKRKAEYNLSSGYVYPSSSSGKDFVSAMVEVLTEHNVKIRTNTKVSHLLKKEDVFYVGTGGDSPYFYSCKYLVIASGGLALPSSGSDGSMFPLLENMGHHFIPPLPALTHLVSQDVRIRNLSGVRTTASITAICNQREIGTEIGELQFSDKGISGIPAMQLSGRIGRKLYEGHSITCSLDFFPYLELPVLEKELKERRHYLAERESHKFFSGMLQEKLAKLFLSELPKDILKVKQMSDEILKRLCQKIKNYTCSIFKVGDFSVSQTTSGGIPLTEVDEDLASNFVNHLYFCGEVLDVDGLCGGYNLTWAWASAYRISKKIGEEKNGKIFTDFSGKSSS